MKFMTIFTLILLSIGLAMDAFAVSISEGVAVKRLRIKQALTVAITFSVFQAFMPLLGFILGRSIYNLVHNYSNIIASILLIGIGLKMLYEAYQEEQCERDGKCELNYNLILLAIATSIDALAAGFSLAFTKHLNIIFSVAIIGFITFIICFSGVYIGNKANKFLNTKAEFFGAFVLIILGIKNFFI
jgi:putative Mn2+ efflux pump MntP